MRLNKVFLLLLFIPFLGCEEDVYTPKPKGYFRIDLPEKNYVKYDKDCPFTFEAPTYSAITYYQNQTEPCWFNIDYRKFHARLHLSYKKVENNLRDYTEDSRSFTQKHIVKATDIRENMVVDDSLKVYGVVYEIDGNVASSIQFHLTDSTQHFIRGSLYFDSKPNADSLAPVLNFLKEDIYHMVETFKWR